MLPRSRSRSRPALHSSSAWTFDIEASANERSTPGPRPSVVRGRSTSYSMPAAGPCATTSEARNSARKTSKPSLRSRVASLRVSPSRMGPPEDRYDRTRPRLDPRGGLCPCWSLAARRERGALLLPGDAHAPPAERERAVDVLAHVHVDAAPPAL